jgi:AcrR family transcriptional regulator
MSQSSSRDALTLSPCTADLARGSPERLAFFDESTFSFSSDSLEWPMAYRRTENVIRRLAARHDAIVRAAGETANEGGMAAIQIAPVAARAGIAAGTVYRYFPGKIELVGALIEHVLEREIAAMRRAADAAPGPLSALSAVMVTFGARALRSRRLAWAVMAEPVDGETEAQRLRYRKAFADEIEARIAAAIAGGHLPEQDTALAAAAAVGALIEGLIGPLAPAPADDPAGIRAAVQAVALNVLRGLGVVDARARGLVVQTALPQAAAGAA